MTLGELKQTFQQALTTLYPNEEVDALFFIAIDHLWNFSRIDYMLNSRDNLNNNQIKEASEFISQLKTGAPIQHIIGYTEFFDLNFKVDKNTLIPRPETEELVSLILNKHNNSPKTLLDIGTGSGCIPISLKYHRKDWNIYSCDISEDALKIAKQNAKDLAVEVGFIHTDILKFKEYSNFPNCDIIVSNPPYVTQTEKTLMHQNVLNHDPHLALFVPDSKPLMFYEAITEFASINLNANGWLYFEINEAFGNEMIALLNSFGFINIELIKDINGKNRIIYGQKSLC